MDGRTNTLAQINHYHSTATESDVNLIEIVREMLCSVGLKQEVLKHYDTNVSIINGLQKPSDVQRYILNKYFHEVFIQSEVCTVSVRSKLIANAQATYWLEVFEQGVLPFILEHEIKLGYG